MSIKILPISSLIGAVVIAALVNISLMNSVISLRFFCFWGGTFLAAWLYKCLNVSPTIGGGIAVGRIARVFAAVTGFLSIPASA
jgi:hypothetical protein